MSAGVSGGEKDLPPVPSLESSADNAGDIVPPGDVVDLVGVGGVAGDRAGVDGPFGTELGIQNGGMSLNRTKVEGVEPMGVVRGEDEVPTQFL